MKELNLRAFTETPNKDSGKVALTGVMRSNGRKVATNRYICASIISEYPEAEEWRIYNHKGEEIQPTKSGDRFPNTEPLFARLTRGEVFDITELAKCAEMVRKNTKEAKDKRYTGDWGFYTFVAFRVGDMVISASIANIKLLDKFVTHYNAGVYTQVSDRKDFVHIYAEDLDGNRCVLGCVKCVQYGVDTCLYDFTDGVQPEAITVEKPEGLENIRVATYSKAEPNKAIIKSIEVVRVADNVYFADGEVWIYYGSGVGFSGCHMSEERLRTISADQWAEELKRSGYDSKEAFTSRLDNLCNSGGWISNADIKVMESFGESERVERFTAHRAEYKRKQEEAEDQKRRARREAEELEQVERVEAFNKAIADAVESIKRGEELKDRDIVTISGSEKSIILALFEYYDITLPLKLKGWVNKALECIYVRVKTWDNNRKELSYRYYTKIDGKRVADSTVMSGYLEQLYSKVLA